MWLVSEIQQIGYSARRQSVPFVELIRKLKYSYKIILSETNTGETECIASGYSDKFLDMIQQYEPYGCSDWPTWARGTIKHKMLIAVNKTAFQFLNYVDKVELIRLPLEHPVSEYLWKSHDNEFNIRYSGIDSERSLIHISFVLRAIGVQTSLFNAMCFAKVAWQEDCAYLFESCTADGVGCLKVSFEDVTRARGLLAKAVTMRYNPVDDYVRSLR